MLISAFLIAAKTIAFVVALGLAGRAALRLVFRQRLADSIDPWSAIAAGAVCLYVSLMIVRQVSWAVVAVCVLGALGAWQIYREHRAGNYPERTARIAWWELGLAVPLVAVILAVPVTEWDARSIWFFHAKIIFYQGLDTDTWRWVAREAGWSHPHYPELLPALAGTAAWLFGFWNDYLPKLGLVVLVVPAMFLGSRLFADWRGRALFWILTFAVMRRFLWNGYMDAHLAVWSTVALLHVLGAFLGAVPVARAMAVSALALSICIGLKVEGWVVAASFFGGLFAVHVAQRRAERSSLRDYASAAAVVAVPFLLWRICRYQLGIGEGWGTLSSDYLGRAAQRLFDTHAVLEILREMFRGTILVSIALLGALMVALRNAGPAWRRACAAGLLVVMLYWLALFFAYLGTPLDLEYHLRTSVARTVLPPRTWVLALLLAGYMVWRGAWRTETPK